MKKALLGTMALVLIILGYIYLLPKPEKVISSETLEPGEIVVIKPVFDVKIPNHFIEYDKVSVSKTCQMEDDMLCAIDLMVKCTVDPTQSWCDKSKMPRFVFMEDESLGRPSRIILKVDKISPIDLNSVEVFTESKCNGQWFDLCEGKVIYVLRKKNNVWTVKDVYAME